MTKKEEKAAAVAAKKRAAFAAKVHRLIGYVPFIGAKIKREEVNAAYDAGIEAEVFAAEIAAREPVGKAVHPLKVQAVKSANKYAKQEIENVRAKLEAANWDVNVVAPYPARNVHGFAWQAAYRYYNHVSKLTQWRQPTRSGADKGPLLVDMHKEGCAGFINQCEIQAAEQYDLFIIKLVGKVGEASAAVLEGDHVWSYSILKVTKGGIIEKWKTQQIENVSKLGLYFPQWPTRLMKG